MSAHHINQNTPPYWEPKKILDYLKRHEPTKTLPADSTAGLILERTGLVKPRKKHCSVPAAEQAFGKVRNNKNSLIIFYMNLTMNTLTKYSVESVLVTYTNP